MEPVDCTARLRLSRFLPLAINAEDDPFQPGDSIPTEGANRSSHLAILATKYGGHVGFMEGWMPNGYFYSDRVFSQYIQAVVSNKKSDMLMLM